MTEIFNGVELYNINREKAGTAFFDNNNLYFAIGLSQPIVFENIHEDVIQQLGDFFYYLGKNPETAANRIDFKSSDKEISIKVMGTTIYLTQNRTTVMFESIGPSELKRFGTYLRKRAK